MFFIQVMKYNTTVLRLLFLIWQLQVFNLSLNVEQMLFIGIFRSIMRNTTAPEHYSNTHNKK